MNAADRPPRDRINWIIPPLLALVLTAPALWTGFFVDDLWHQTVFTKPAASMPYMEETDSMFSFTDGDPVRTRLLMDMGVLPWWTLEEVKLRFWRPVTAWTHAIDYAAWPHSPMAMHAQSVLWYAAGVLLVTLLYRRILGVGATALIAAVLFAVDDAHSVPAGWLANRNAVIALSFGVAALLMHDRWRRRGPVWIVAPAVACLLGSVLANEGGIATTAYLFAYAVCLDSGSWRKRMASLIPYAIVIVLWRIVYSLQGFGAAESASYIDPVTSPMDFISALIVRTPILLAAQLAAPPADLFTFLPYAIKLAWWTIAIAVGAVAAAVFWPLIRQRPQARYFAAGGLLSIVPFAATFPMDRLLLFSGIGAMGLIAMALHDWHTSPRPRRRIATMLAAVAIALHLVIAPLLLPVRIVAWDRVGQVINNTFDSVRFDDTIKGKTVVIANAPNLFFATYMTIVKATQNSPMPDRIVSLAPNSGVPVPIVIIRPDARTLIYRPDAAYQWVLFRDDHHPFKPGDTVALDGYSVTVQHTTESGVPVEVAFRFNTDLDDPSLVWLQFVMPGPMLDPRAAFVPFTPPAIGETMLLTPGGN